jgi:hypothetical protein
MPPAGFEPAIPGSERLQTHAKGYAATVIGLLYLMGGVKILLNFDIYSLNEIHLQHEKLCIKTVK